MVTLETFTEPNKIQAIIKISISFPRLEEEPKQLAFDNFLNINVNHKKQLLSQSIDKLNAKYGSGTVSFGQIPKKKNLASIVAFKYISDD